MRAIYLIAFCILACNQTDIATNKSNELHTTSHQEDTEEVKHIQSSIPMLDDAHYSAVVNDRNNTDLLLEFYADWCQTCRNVAPSLEALHKRHPNLKMYRIDVDDNPRSAKTCNVAFVPTMIMFHHGIRGASLVGANSDAVLDRFVEGNPL